MIVEKLKNTHVEIRELVLEKANIVEVGNETLTNVKGKGVSISSDFRVVRKR